MNFNGLIFDVRFAVIATVLICVYNQWNFNPFAYCGFNRQQNEFDETFKINSVFKVASINISCVGSVEGQNRDSRLSLFIGLELLFNTTMRIEYEQVTVLIPWCLNFRKYNNTNRIWTVNCPYSLVFEGPSSGWNNAFMQFI